MASLTGSVTFDQFRCATWIVESGSENPKANLSSIIEAAFPQSKLTWAFDEEKRTYAALQGRDINLRANCTFARVNGLVVCMLTPVGRYCDLRSMIKFTSELCGFSNHEAKGTSLDSNCEISTSSFLKSLNSIDRKAPKTEPEMRKNTSDFSNEVKTLFDQTDLIVNVRGDFTRLTLENGVKLTENLTWENLPERTTFTYSKLSPEQEEAPYICSARCHLARLDDVLIAFIYNADNYGDMKKLREMAWNWCPQAKRLVAQEDLGNFVTYFSSVHLLQTYRLLRHRELSGSQYSRWTVDQHASDHEGAK